MIALALAFGLTAVYWMSVQDIAPHIAHIDAPPDPLRFRRCCTERPRHEGEGYACILTLLLGVLGLIASERREKWFLPWWR